MVSKEEVQKYYDRNVLRGWTRIERHPVEYEINMRYTEHKGFSIIPLP